MKKLLLLGAALVAVISTLSVGTWAYFNDVETSTGNTITAGTLNLTADEVGGGSVAGTLTAGDDGANEYLTLSDVKPGGNGTITWTLTNIGSIAGTMTITSTVSFSEGSNNEPETAAIAANSATNLGLGDLVGVKLQRGSTYILGTADNFVPLSGLEAALDAETSKAMAASGSIVYTLSWDIPTDVKKVGTDGVFGILTPPGTSDDAVVDDNIIQGDSATIGITFTLTQS